MTSSLLLIGESPPPGAAPDFRPFDCASGTRLASIMLGLRGRDELLAHVPRTNIFDAPTGPHGCQKWDAAVARMRGATTLHKMSTRVRTIVALGRKTAEALGIPHAVPDRTLNWTPPLGTTWQRMGTRCIYAPHPSGASSALNSAEVRADMRAMLIPELILGAPTLRPWHFRLDDPATLADLSAALSPRCPALGAAALTWAAEQHVARVARDSAPILAAMSKAFGGAAFATGPNPWDEPLVNLARDLLQHDGGRVLGERWDPHGSVKRGGPGWLVARAAQHHADLNNYSRAHIRATLQRYAMAGLT